MCKLERTNDIKFKQSLKIQQSYKEKEGFKEKEIFCNLTLIMNTFLSKPIKKHTNHIRENIQTISVKYWINLTTVEN